MKRATLLLLLPLTTLPAGCGPGSGGSAPAVPSPPPAAVTLPAEAPPASGGVYSTPQAERGRAAFRESCAECHYSSEFRGSQFQFSWGRRSVGDLYAEIVRNMPEDAPGGLAGQTYVDIVAYILQLNGFPAGDRELPVDEAVLDGYSMTPPSGDGGARGIP